jgi:EmrB/QacA subfamily drug resistance transporter
MMVAVRNGFGRPSPRARAGSISTRETFMSTPATAARSGGHAPPGGQLSHRQILEILGGLMMGMFLAALDQTIVASAIRTIGDDLHGLSIQAWVTTAYLITATISTPLYGKLSDMYGRKPFFLAAITIFTAGSALCAFSTSMYMLAAFRAFQGLGAGGLFSLALAIIGDIVPPRERARYQGYFLAVFGTSSVLGPVIGGFFAGASSILGITGWRWVFLVNVPIGLAALVVVSRVLNIAHTRRDHKIDWLGAVTLTVGLVPLLIVAEQGRTWGWGSTRALVCYVIGVIGVLAFVGAEARAGEDALIPLRMFRNRTFSLTSAVGIVVGMGMFGGIAALPLYLQIVKGASPTKSGLLLLPLTAGIMLASIFSGQLISKTGRYKIFPIIGSLLMVAGMLLLHTVGADTPFWRTSLYMAVFGLGLGNVMQPITLAVQNAMPPQDIGVATSSATFFRQLGGTLGTAVFLSVLFSTVGDKIKGAFRAAAQTPQFQAALKDPSVASNPANKPVLDALHGGGSVGGSALNDTSFIQHLAKVLARPFEVGFSQAMDLVFLLGAGVLFIGFVLLLFLPELALRTQSAMVAAAEGVPDGIGTAGGAPAQPTAASRQD